jgi:beta-glucanase (GH16 family)
MDRRTFLTLLGGTGIAVSGCAARSRSNPRTSYTFSDEFDGPVGSVPDPDRWSIADNPNLSGGIQVYTDSRQTAFLDGKSHLVISAQPNGLGGYDSARLTTLGKFSQLGGWFEARVKLDAAQPGCWPAFWLVGQDINQVGWPWCGEVDILEDFGTRPPEITSTVHVPSDDPKAGITALRTNQEYRSLSSDSAWHTYLLHWDLKGQSFTFYRDGVSYFTTGIRDFNPAFWVYGPEQKNNGGMSIILNLAIGGYVGAPHPSSWPVRMYVDYVRTWQ